MFISEVVKKGWEETKKSFWFFVALLILFFVIIAVLVVIMSKLSIQGGIAMVIVQIIYFLIVFYLSIGLIIISLKKAKGESSSIGDLFKGFPYLASYAGATILYALICMAGMILLIFPGVIWGLKYMFYPYLIVDKKMKAIESLKASSKITLGNKWDLLGFSIVISIIEFIGVLCLIIGIFWAWPTTLIAQALIYYKLAEKL